MRRRDFIGVIGSAVTWSVTARAQPSLPVVGFLSSRSPAESEPDVAGFRQGLSQSGYVEHQNVVIEYRWAENQYDRLPALAAELVKRQVRVIAALGGPVTALAVKAATKTVPFVFITGVDPVKLGLVDSFAKPGGNATGVNMFITAVEAKRLGLLHELVPNASQIAVIVNPNSPEIDRQLNDLQAAAQVIRRELQIFRVSAETEFETVFAALAQNSVAAVLVAADPFFNSHRARIVALAERYKIPAIYEARGYALAGGLMSYGPNLPDMYRQVGLYTGQILKGAKPADLPVMQPTALELVINLRAAKAIGLAVSTQLQQRADEVIE
jgi:putative tryptophan/tyrosine transport system substrate-binding protein